MKPPRTNPKRGDRFLHAHQIDGSPKAGTATPVEMEVTAVRGLMVYYRRADHPGCKGSWYIDRDDFHTIVKEESVQ